jgi:hypothetical protein
LFLSELDEAWALGLAEAERRARAAGRTDVADYLALRNSNDLIRQVARDWLLGIFTAAAGQANRAGAAIQISNEDQHRFKIGNAWMTGNSLSLICGVRRLVVEVGWPRTPRDGFIQGGGLARGQIKHIGIQTANEELRLTLNSAGTPVWMAQFKHHEPRALHETDVRDHFEILLDHAQPKPRHS